MVEVSGSRVYGLWELVWGWLGCIGIEVLVLNLGLKY